MQVEWDHHSSELVERLTSFLEEGALQDVTLCSSEGKKIKAHRVILAATSNYFKVRFSEIIQLIVSPVNLISIILEFNVDSFNMLCKSYYRKYSYLVMLMSLENFQLYFLRMFHIPSLNVSYNIFIPVKLYCQKV